MMGEFLMLHGQSAKECCFSLDPMSTRGVNLLEPVSQGSGSSGARGRNLEEFLISGPNDVVGMLCFCPSLKP